MTIPNHTQISNYFIDKIIPILEHHQSALIFLVISRKTIGWHKECEIMSVELLKRMTNLSCGGLQSGIKELLDLNVIVRERNCINESYSYFINYDISSYSISSGDISRIDKDIKDTNTKNKLIQKEKKLKQASSLLPDDYLIFWKTIYKEKLSRDYIENLVQENKALERIKQSYSLDQFKIAVKNLFNQEYFVERTLYLLEDKFMKFYSYQTKEETNYNKLGEWRPQVYKKTK